MTLRQGNTPAEKRTYLRYPCNISIASKLRFGRHHEYMKKGGSGYLESQSLGEAHARVVALSRGGACVEANYEIPRNTKVEVLLETAFTAPIRAVARVAWSRPKQEERPESERGDKAPSYLVGLAFIKMGWLDRRRLERFLRTLSAGAPQKG